MGMIRAHGGHLVNRKSEKTASDYGTLSTIDVSTEIAEDIINIANGVFSPLEGFLGYNDLENVVTDKRLSDDTPWTIPILLDCERKKKSECKEGDTIFLRNDSTGVLASIDIEDMYSYDKEGLAKAVYQTNDKNHPGVANIYGKKHDFISGKITLLSQETRKYDDYNLSPTETRFLFAQKGWRDIVAFQTRNPPHIGHEYVQKTALTFTDGLFINPIIGKKKKGDFTDEVILASYENLLKHYYLKKRAVMSILRTTMRYAGPREAIHHAIIRKNYGCTHFIVGRDHAGVGNYYGPYDAHEIFDEFPDLGIIPLFFRSFSRCTKCGSVVNDKICPHGQEHHINFSGKKIREFLRDGKVPPLEMMRKEVADTILGFDHPFVE